jgi:hypothetical protein
MSEVETLQEEHAVLCAVAAFYGEPNNWKLRTRPVGGADPAPAHDFGAFAREGLGKVRRDRDVLRAQLAAYQAVVEHYASAAEWDKGDLARLTLRRWRGHD